MLIKIQIVLLVLTLSGCSTFAFGIAPTTIVPIKPIDAHKYEDLVKYSCNGALKYEANGTSGCQYNTGDTIDLWVKVPPVSGQIIVRSTRSQIVQSFKSGPWVRVSWKLNDEFDSVPIVVSVASDGLGIQKAKIFPYVITPERARMTQTLHFYCFEDGTYREAPGQGWCQQPAGANVNGLIHVDPTKAGSYLIQADGCDPIAVEDDIEVLSVANSFPVGTLSIPFDFSKTDKGYCSVGIFIKYTDGTSQRARLHLDFWDPEYSPLNRPSLAASGAKVKGCASAGYKYFDLNDRSHKNCWFSSSCATEPWLPDGTGYITAWDESGRTAVGLITKVGP